MNRRQFIGMGLCAGAALLLPGAVLGRTVSGYSGKVLHFHHTHTGERLWLVYDASGRFDGHALDRVNYFLRDFRTGEVHDIDPALLDILCSINDTFGGASTIEVISGYRSAKTNAALRAKSTGVARRSLHMKGKAIDIRLRGVRTASLRDCALKMRCGGVGYYPASNFVHVDTGRVRHW